MCKSRNKFLPEIKNRSAQRAPSKIMTCTALILRLKEYLAK